MDKPSKNMVNWFEIAVDDMDRAQQFYEAVFQTKLEDSQMPGMDMKMFPWNHDAPGAAGALVKSEHYQPSASGTVVYFGVENLDNELSRVEENGGKIIVPKMGIGEHGFIAQFTDTEGNRIALHSM